MPKKHFKHQRPVHTYNTTYASLWCMQRRRLYFIFVAGPDDALTRVCLHSGKCWSWHGAAPGRCCMMRLMRHSTYNPSTPTEGGDTFLKVTSNGCNFARTFSGVIRDRKKETRIGDMNERFTTHARTRAHTHTHTHTMQRAAHAAHAAHAAQPAQPPCTVVDYKLLLACHPDELSRGVRDMVPEWQPVGAPTVKWRGDMVPEWQPVGAPTVKWRGENWKCLYTCAQVMVKCAIGSDRSIGSNDGIE